jgi:dsDNA-specific endonuclease/ATPase MutS2
LEKIWQPKKQELRTQIGTAIEEVSESKNFKINQINSGIDKKSKQVLKVVSDILSRKLAKFLVDEIIEDIVAELNRK